MICDGNCVPKVFPTSGLPIRRSDLKITRSYRRVQEQALIRPCLYWYWGLWKRYTEKNWILKTILTLLKRYMYHVLAGTAQKLKQLPSFLIPTIFPHWMKYRVSSQFWFEYTYCSVFPPQQRSILHFALRLRVPGTHFKTWNCHREFARQPRDGGVRWLRHISPSPPFSHLMHRLDPFRLPPNHEIRKTTGIFRWFNCCLESLILVLLDYGRAYSVY